MKAEGLDYDQRMEELEKIEYPKPLRDFVYSTFNAFADRHPWVGEENIRPKSIAREMFEGFRSFADYVQEYDLERAEGLLLRHLNSVYKVLSQTVPDAVKTDAVREMELYLRDMLRQVDSSLLEEWERMRDPDYVAGRRRARSCGRRGRRSRRTSPATRRPSPPRSARASSRSCARGRSADDEAALALIDAPGGRRTASRGRRSGCAPRARPTASSTPASASTPRRATSATRTVDAADDRRHVARRSRCWSTRRA